MKKRYEAWKERNCDLVLDIKIMLAAAVAGSLVIAIIIIIASLFT